MTTQQGSDYIPIKTTIVSVEKDVAELFGGNKSTPVTPQKKVNKKVTITSSYQMNTGDLPQCILTHAPSRCKAQIILNGVSTSTLVIGRSSSDCQEANAMGATGFVGSVTYYAFANKQPIIIPIEGSTELWALQIGGAAPMTISVFKEYYGD